jgi:ABC-type multidrug transport system fused ATPase/permease subunit
VIVLEKGELVEFGTPFELLTENSSVFCITKKSKFAEMVLATG